MAFDVRRLVDAHAQGRSYQGITRYAARLYRELKSRSDEVVMHPVYVHGAGTVSGLDAAASVALEEWTSCEGTPLTRAPSDAGSRALAIVNRLQRRLQDVPLAPRVLGRFERLLRRARALDSASRELGADVFHSPVNPLPRDPRMSRPRVLTVHDCIYLKYPEFYPVPGQTPAIRRALDSIDVDRDYVICNSESTRRDLMTFLDIPRERTWVTPLAADNHFFTPDRQIAARRLSELGLEQGRFVVALAQSEKRKNIPRLVQAFHRARKEDDWKLLLVCGADYAPRLRELLQEKGLLSESLCFATGVDDRTLAGLFGLARAFVYVPLYEGFGIPPLEAMAAGCPVVVANNSSIPEVVGEAGVYVDAQVPESIGQGLSRLLEDGDLPAGLAEAGRIRAGGFSWRRTAAMTLEVYREIRQRPLAEERRRATGR